MSDENVESLESKKFKEYLDFINNFNKKFNDNSYIINEISDTLYSMDICFLDVRRKPIEYQLSVVSKVNKKLYDKYCWKSTVPDLKAVIEELRKNILLEQYYSAFYCIQRFSEILTDRLLSDYIKGYNQKSDKIIECMDRKVFTFNTKIGMLKHYLSKIEDKDDLLLLIELLKLINTIRDTYMFHLNNFEEYWHIFLEEHKKEEFLCRIFKDILDQINIVKQHSKKYENVSKILDYFKDSYERVLEMYKKIIEDTTPCGNFVIYESFPKELYLLSFSLFKFLEKSELKFIKN